MDIFLPLLNKSLAIDLHLRLPLGAKASIETPDVSEVVYGKGEVVSMLLPVGEKTISQGYWNAAISFYNEEKALIEGEVVKVNWMN